MEARSETYLRQLAQLSSLLERNVIPEGPHRENSGKIRSAASNMLRRTCLAHATICVAAILLLACPTFVSRACGESPLRKLADARGVRVGVMPIDADWIANRHRDLVAREFNTITKGIYWLETRPSAEQWQWGPVDEVVDWARQRDMAVRLHPLVYAEDQKTPPWVLETPASQARELLRRHIAETCRHFAGRVDSYDVVNEAISPDGRGLQDCWWLRSPMGRSYVKEAFRAARQYAPGVHLVLNENNCELGNDFQTRKWNEWLALLKELHAEKLVDGAGWQLHTTPDKVLGPDFDLDARMRQLADLGLVNHVTELDLALDDDSPESLARQGEAAKRITAIWLARGGGSFTTWGVSDKTNWMKDLQGRECWPLMFDEDHRPKPFYFGVAAALRTAVPRKIP
jgi:endo-1,4-beta-xylanase